MRDRIRRFIDWMEVAPAYKTIWLLPLVLVLYIYAKLANISKGKL